MVIAARQTALRCLGLLAAFLVFRSGPALAQSCSWSGSSNVPAPTVTALGSVGGFFHAPTRLATDKFGNIYVTDPAAGSILVTDPRGELIDAKGDFSAPLSIAVANDQTLYVGELGSGSVTILDRAWEIVGTLGQGEGEFAVPTDIAIDPDPAYGFIYVSDAGSHEIKVYGSDGALVRKIGGAGEEPGKLNFPAAVYINPAGELFVGDQSNDRVQVFSRDGSFLRCFGASGGISFSNKFGRIMGITGDRQGRIYVTDAFQGYVHVFDRQGASIGTVGSFGRQQGQLRTPVGVAIDLHNRLLVASLNNGRLEMFGLDNFSQPSEKLTAIVDVRRNKIRRATRRKFVKVLVEIPRTGVTPGAVVYITANRVPADSRRLRVRDRDHDGFPELLVRFPASSLLATLPDGDATVAVSGELSDGTAFGGSDTVTVVSPGN